MKLLRRIFRRRAVEQEMREEMAFHMEERAGALRARGMTSEEAERAARVEFGNRERYREECRAELGYRLWDELRSDVRFALRSIRNHPGYSATAIAILAVAIAVNSAFFALISHHVLKPLTIRGADRHFDLRGLDERARWSGGWTAAELETLRQGSRNDVEGLYTARTVQVLVLEPTQRLGLISLVSGNYFRLLSNGAAVGRVFSDAEESEAVAVLSQSGLRRHFPDDPMPIGRTLRIRGAVLTILGVMPAEFTGADSLAPDLWVGSGMDRVVAGPSDASEPRYTVYGLLAEGVSLRRAESVLTAVASGFSHRQEKIAKVQLTKRSGFVAADEDFAVAASAVFAAFLMVMAVACANLANLSLSRAASRTHEIAMRVSLGASRSRIVRQLLTESTMLAVVGAAGGIVLGAIGVEHAQAGLQSYAGGLGITMLPAAGVDWRVVVFSACLGVLAGLAFGLLPAIEVTAPSLTQSTKRHDSSFAGRVRPRRMRNLLIVGQVAASVVLLIVAAVLTRHIHNLNISSPGYDLDRIHDLRVDNPSPTLIALLGQQSFVDSISAVERVPLYGDTYQTSATADNQLLMVSYNHVDHRYFETLGVSVAGRGFTLQESAANAKVVVISQATARRLWPSTNAVGRSIRVDQGQDSGLYEVIGVVPDVVSGWLFRGKDRTAVYIPAAAGQKNLQSAMVRLKGYPPSSLAAIRKLCASVADATGCEPTSLREVAGMQRFPFQAASAIAMALGLVALALTAVGLYSVISYSVVHRRREIGVHLALGASSMQIVRRVLGEAWLCVIFGMAVGIPVCLILSRLIRASVLGIDTSHAGQYGTVIALLAVVATAACAVPTRGALRIDPMALLREE